MFRSQAIVILAFLSFVGGAQALAQAPSIGDAKATSKSDKFEMQRKADEQLQIQAAERLKRLADYLDETASTASQEVAPVREAIDKGGADTELDRSLGSVGRNAKSVIVKQALESSAPVTSRKSAFDPKIVGGSVVTQITYDRCRTTLSMTLLNRRSLKLGRCTCRST